MRLITELRVYPDQGPVIAVIADTTPVDVKPLTNGIVGRFLDVPGTDAGVERA